MPNQDLTTPDNDHENQTVVCLTQSAKMVAIAVVIGIIAAYVPVLTIIAPFFFPVPIAICYFRQGGRVAIIATVCIYFILLALTGWVESAYLMLQFGFLGLLIGYSYLHGTKQLFTLTWATIIAFAGMLLSIWLALYVSGQHFDYLFNTVKDFAKAFTSAIVGQGQSAESAFFGTMTADQYTVYIQDMLIRHLPSILFIASMITAMFCYLLSGAIMKRLRYKIRPLPSFSNWRIDWRLMWGIVAALIIAGCGGFFDNQLLKDIGDNILIVFCPVLFVCGLSFLVWVLKNIHVQSWMIFVILIIIFFQFYPTIFLILFIGAFDAVFNFRMRITNFRDKMDKGDF